MKDITPPTTPPIGTNRPLPFLLQTSGRWVFVIKWLILRENLLMKAEVSSDWLVFCSGEFHSQVEEGYECLVGSPRPVGTYLHVKLKLLSTKKCDSCHW